jgi:hypothetical protein
MPTVSVSGNHLCSDIPRVHSLLFDIAEGEFENCPIQVIDKITIDLQGDIMPSSTSRPMFVRTEKPRPSLVIEFAKDRTSLPGFGRTMNAVFELVQPSWDVETAQLLPLVSFKIYDGLAGLARFAENVSRHPYLHILQSSNICIARWISWR